MAPFTERKKDIGFQTLMTLAAFVVVVAGLKAVSSILLPVLIAVFLAVLSIPPVAWLQRHRVPDKLAAPGGPQYGFHLWR